MIPLKCQVNHTPLLLKAPWSFSTIRIKFKSLHAAQASFVTHPFLPPACLSPGYRGVWLPPTAEHPSPPHFHWLPFSLERAENGLSELGSLLPVTWELLSLKLYREKALWIRCSVYTWYLTSILNSSDSTAITLAPASVLFQPEVLWRIVPCLEAFTSTQYALARTSSEHTGGELSLAWFKNGSHRLMCLST